MIPLSKIAVAKDNSYAKLFSLLQDGYDTVQWVNAEVWGQPCPLCAAIEQQVNAKGGIDLANFLGYKRLNRVILDEETGEKVPDVDENGIQRFELEPAIEIIENAPIYTFSHVGCRCCLLISKRDGTGEQILVTRAG